MKKCMKTMVMRLNVKCIICLLRINLLPSYTGVQEIIIKEKKNQDIKHESVIEITDLQDDTHFKIN